MWIIAKINSNEKELFKTNFQSKIKDKIDFYAPSIEIKKKFLNKFKRKKISLLGNYIFCYNASFTPNFIKKFNFIKGLKYFLKNSSFYQEDIQCFIDSCKSCENQDGIITSTLYSELEKKKYKFLNGPLADVVFNITSISSKYVFGTLKNNNRIVVKRI